MPFDLGLYDIQVFVYQWVYLWIQVQVIVHINLINIAMGEVVA